jgi:hypothetical protein
MPQVAIETFVSQYFWLLVFLVPVDYVPSMVVIPNVVTTLRARKVVASDSEETEASESESLVERDSILGGTFSVVVDVTSSNTSIKGALEGASKSLA